MSLSKKEISNLIEIVFSILFTIIFMPFFYESQDISFVLSDLMGKGTGIIIFAIIYFSISYSLLEFIYKNKIIEDERDDMINSKSYKLGYLLYELSLFVFIGTLLTNTSQQNNGAIIFVILLLRIFQK